MILSVDSVGSEGFRGGCMCLCLLRTLCLGFVRGVMTTVLPALIVAKPAKATGNRTRGEEKGAGGALMPHLYNAPQLSL